jgi:hypothetical protein
MDKELQKRFHKDYPDLFRDKDLPMNKSCMFWGIEFGDGWAEILKELCDTVTFLQKKSGYSFVFSQLKEKWGTMNAYYNLIPNENLSEDEQKMWENIFRHCTSYIEQKSLHTCETCGRHGRVYKNGWYKSLCIEHAVELGRSDKDGNEQ